MCCVRSQPSHNIQITTLLRRELCGRSTWFDLLQIIILVNNVLEQNEEKTIVLNHFRNACLIYKTGL